MGHKSAIFLYNTLYDPVSVIIYIYIIDIMHI